MTFILKLIIKMDNFNKNREEEINKAILEWIIKKNYSNSIEPFLNDTGLKAENSAKDNMLERKWGTIILLQKKVLDLENQLKNLSDELSLKSSSSYSTKKDLESFVLFNLFIRDYQKHLLKLL